MHAFESSPAVPAPKQTALKQRVIKVQRDYNAWVASQSLADCRLRTLAQNFQFDRMTPGIQDAIARPEAA